MLRILTDTTSPGCSVLRLAGDIRDEWVGELRRACDEVWREHGATAPALALDLRDVSFIDAAGLTLCAELSSRGVRLINCSLFAAEQLKGLAHVNR